jgi:hypothetical protein
MTPTLTAPDPAIFPADVRAFAAERGVTDYLVPLYDLVKQCFAGAGVTVTFARDYEIPGLCWIVYEVTVSHWDLERIQAAYHGWLGAFSAACPADAAEAFALVKR